MALSNYPTNCSARISRTPYQVLNQPSLICRHEKQQSPESTGLALLDKPTRVGLIKVKQMKKAGFKLVTEYPVASYKCGLRVGDSLKLKRDIELKSGGRTTGRILSKGGVWKVLAGSKEEPVVVWLRQPDGRSHTWEDDLSIFEYFERYEPDA